MDFQLTDEQKLLKDSARAFVDKEIAPAAQERDARGPLSRDETIAYIKKLMPFGYYNGWMRPEFGGAELDNRTLAVLHEELARGWLGLAGTVWIAGAAGGAARAEGSRRQTMIEKVRAGEAIGCGAITEPDFGSNSSAITTTAVADGDDWVVNGTKAWISNAPICDHVALFAQVQKADGSSGIQSIFVEKEVSPFESRSDSRLFGARAWPNGSLTFQDCRVPRVSDEARGIRSERQGRRVWTFESPRTTLAIMSVGVAQAAIDASISYARERPQFGRPIGAFQLVQEMIVDMIIETEAARLLAYQAADLLDRDEDCSWQASAAKAYATEMAIRVTSKAIEVHGAAGLSEDLPLERYFRDARSMTIPDGTTEIQKLVIGRERMGVSAFK
jgi:alkylation response protein AidB-like acyl-CoA dehydrogenase